MTKDETLKLALVALDVVKLHYTQNRHVNEAITAIKEALAQPEPWEKFCDSNCVLTDHHPDCKLAQPQQEPAIGDIRALKHRIHALEGDVLGYKQMLDAAEQPAQQEPVAHLWKHGETGRTRIVMPDQIITADANWFVVGPLVLGTSPPQRKPLTDDEIDLMYVGCKYGSVRELARAVEAAHGIKE